MRKGEGSPLFYAGLGYGSYNTRTAETGFSGNVSNTKFSLSASSSDSKGFSALRTNYNIDKDNDAYRNLAVSGMISHQLSETNELGIQILSSEGHGNYDGGVNTFHNYVDLSQLSYGLFSNNQLLPNWKSTLRVGEGIDDQFNQYGVTSSSKLKTKQRQLSWQNDIGLPIGTLTLLYDRLEQRVTSSTPYEKTERNTDGFLVGYLADIGDHSIQTTLRNDHSAQFGNNTTGGVGYGYKLTPNWRITTSYGKAFRAPTFNDLYYAYTYLGVIYPSNNPNLKAEKSDNIEGSLRYQNASQEVSATIYQNKINDFIALDQNWLPVNVNAKIQGLTIAASQRWESWTLRGSIDVQSPKNEDTQNMLVRRANRHASLNVGKSWGDWNFSTEIVGSSTRYNDSNNQIKLGGYSLVNFTADYKVNSNWSVQGRVNNLFNRDYALAYGTTAIDAGFATPSFSVPYNTSGSNLFVSVRWAPK